MKRTLRIIVGLLLCSTIYAQSLGSGLDLSDNPQYNQADIQKIMAQKNASQTVQPVLEEKESTEISNQIIEHEEQKKIEQEVLNKKSPIEKLYENCGIQLRQFGYDYLIGDVSTNQTFTYDDYIVGVGDSFSLYLWGDSVDILGYPSEMLFQVDNNGNVFIPNLGIINVLNKTVSEIKDIVEVKFRQKIQKFDLEIVINSFKEFNIAISGMVNSPGLVKCSNITSVIDAIKMAGGISKNGSLRNIKLIREGKEINFDLYSCLINGETEINHFLLKENDSLFVDSLGDVVAIKGSINRPGIYEVKPDELVKDIIRFAGDDNISSFNEDINIYSLESENASFKTIDVSEEEKYLLSVSNGMLIDIPVVQFKFDESIIVEGHIRNPGRFDLDKNIDLKSLLENIELYPDTNLLYAEIVRTVLNKKSEYLTFMPQSILDEKENLDLLPGDKIRFVSHYGFEVKKEKFRNIVQLNGVIDGPVVISCSKDLILNNILSVEMLPLDVNLNHASIVRKSFETNEDIVIDFSPLEVLENEKEVKLQPLDNITFYSKWYKKPIKVSGEISTSFILDYYDDVTLLDVFDRVFFDKDVEKLSARIIQGSGIKNIYLYDLLVKGKASCNIPIEPGANIIINEISYREERSKIKILGNVNKPGVYNYVEGMRLSDLIGLAKGLDNDSYLKGLVLFRQSAKELQQQQLEITLNSMASELESLKIQAQQSSMSEEAKAAVMEQAISQEHLLSLTREKAKSTLGRIALVLPENVEQLENDESDILLEEGDYIFVPNRPDYVLVYGNVYNQVSLQYRQDKPVKDYIRQIGGKKKDSGDEYIIHINGQITSNNSRGFLAKKVKNRSLNPGDVIVVPQEIKVPGHIMFFDVFTRIADVLYKTSTTVLSSYGLLNSLGVLN